MMQMERKADRLQSLPGTRQIVGVELDPEQPAGWAYSPEQLHGVAGPADGAIDHHLAGPGVERGQDFPEQHRAVFPGSSAACSARHGVAP
jgi:hypothetical protein